MGIRRGAWAAAVGVVVMMSVLAFASDLTNRLVGGAAALPPTQVAPQGLLRVHGHVGHLWPGRVVRLGVAVRNPFDVPVDVRWVDADPRRGVGPNGTCPARMLVIARWRGHRDIAAHGARRFRLRVRLRRRAPDRCEGARFPLRYAAFAEGDG